MTSSTTTTGVARDQIAGWILAGATTLLLAAVIAQVLTLGTRPAPDLHEWIADHARTLPVQPARGTITDRRGRVLAAADPGARVIVDPVNIDPARADELITGLARALDLPADRFGQRLYRALARNRRIAAAPAAQTTNDDTPPLERLVSAFDRALQDDTAAPDPQRAQPQSTPDDDAPRTVRYVPVGPPMTASRAARALEFARERDFNGVYAEPWPLRTYAGPISARPIVGKVSFDATGVTGAEAAFDDTLRGEPGRLRFVHDASGRPMWIERGGVEPMRPGRDIRLSIDTVIQRIAREELLEGVRAADAAGGRVVFIDPGTGELLAMTDTLRTGVDQPPEGLVDYPWPDADTPSTELPDAPEPGGRYRILPHENRARTEPALWRNRGLLDAYEPGSTFKGFVWALGHAAGAMAPGETITGTGRTGRVLSYGRRVRDVTRRTELDWPGVLVHSSNVGMAVLADRLDPGVTRASLMAMGFGSRTGLGLPGENTGLVQPPQLWNEWTQTSVGFGQEIAVTPAQLARAFCVFARSGDAAGTLPELRTTAVTGDEPESALRTRVLPRSSAERVRELMVRVAERMETGTMPSRPDADQNPRYALFGKSGTAQVPLVPPEGKRRPRGTGGYYPEQYISSFIAGAPVESPRVVVLVLIEDPGPASIDRRQHYGSWVAGPVVQRIVERVLPELGVPPDRPLPGAPGDTLLGG